jgi:hypothetical protein
MLEGIRASVNYKKPDIATIGLLIFGPILLAFYVWLYLFCKSKETQALMKNA